MLATAAGLAAARLAPAFSTLLCGILASATAATTALLVRAAPGASSCKLAEHC